MLDDDGVLFGRLFIAVPELSRDLTLLEALRRRKIITQQEYDDYAAVGRAARRARRVRGELTGQKVLQRILIVAPELFSASSINLLRRFKILDEVEGHQARIAARILGELTSATGKTGLENIALRLQRAFSSAISNESIDLMRLQGLITVEQADRLRASLLAGRRIVNILDQDKSAKSLLQVLQLIGNELFTKDLVRAASLIGLLTPREAQIFNTMIDLGPLIWRTAKGLKAAEGYAQRLLIGANAIIDQRTIDLLRKYNLITVNQARLLRPAVNIAREYTRSALLPAGKGQRYRPVPGESPIKTYARITRQTDRHILALLAQAAEENSKQAAVLAELGGVGAKTRAAQARIASDQLHILMHDLYEDIGHLVIFGEAEAALASLQSMEYIQGRVWRNQGKAMADLQELLAQQGRAGFDSLVSRQENVVALAKSVYKNRDLAMGNVDRRISLGLLRGQSAAEIAKDVAKMIRPDVPGGVSYAATRLARTEINNAFHYTGIRYTREMPWVTGYKWHLSNSHPHTDICNDYANKPFFKKGEVPGKPHPHCFCYVTPITVEPEEFATNMRNGRYDSYLKQISQEASKTSPDNGSRLIRAAAGAIGGEAGKQLLHSAAGRVAVR